MKKKDKQKQDILQYLKKLNIPILSELHLNAIVEFINKNYKLISIEIDESEIINKIAKIIYENTGVTLQEIQSSTRKGEIAFARQLMCVILKDYTFVNRHLILELLGYSNHTIFTSNRICINNYIATDKKKKELIERILKEISE